ncbi:DUF4177 domain-containing protein [Gorillibacterium sp. sgz500922]|uniref:DUF4177 domain-containing protein n=1 Tax=Gorillibacterium sp. sgz500922 TaxID=3446694 RepID=UPI003F66E8E9
MNERWEYKSIHLKTGGVMGGLLDKDEFEERLNALGHEGWELVSVFDTNQGYGATRQVVAVFKRRQ